MNIGVFFGSKSPEHDVSIITGELIISELKRLKHTVIPIYLSKEGQWYIDENLGSLSVFKDSHPNLNNYNKVYLDLESSQGQLLFVKKGFIKKEYKIDIAFPAFHGAYGEDGTIQGLFEMFNIPYVGCDVPSSAITIDKIVTKLLCKQLGIKTVDFLYFTAADWSSRKLDIITECEQVIGFPAFVKPPKLGSSIGITKAKNISDLENAIDVALKYGSRVLIEKAVPNIVDLTCAVLGNDNPVASLIQESSFKNDLFSYEDKYLDDGGAQFGNNPSNLTIPANIPTNIADEIQKFAIKIFISFGCSGISRIDFLYNKETHEYFANEINPLPGTLYHHLWKASGIPIDELVTKLLDLAIEKNKKENAYIQTFESSILQYANSIKLNISDKK